MMRKEEYPMKKMVKVFLSLLLVCPILFLSAFDKKAQAAEMDTVDIVLHKRIFRDVHWHHSDKLDAYFYGNDGLPIDKENIEDDSQENELLKNSIPLNGAQYMIWDATKLTNVDTFKKYYQDSSIKETKDIVQVFSRMKRSGAIELAQKADLPQISIEGNTTIVTKKDLISKKNPTSTQAGIARFDDLARKDGEQFKAYLIVETGVSDTKELNVDLEKFSRPILVTLPIMVNNEELTEIHLYPKNVGYVRDPYFYKFGQSQSGEDLGALAGAEFVLYREEDGKKLYLDMSKTTDLKNKWVESADPAKDTRVNKFVSDNTGLVNTGERFLPSGTFYFEEVKAADGYEITSEARKVEVIVPTSWDDPVTINGQEMAELVTGIVPESAQKSQTPRVYNTQSESEIPPQDSSGQETSTRLRLPQTLGQLIDTVATTGRRMLPRTNEGKAAFSVVGVVVAGIAVFLWRKKHDDEDK